MTLSAQFAFADVTVTFCL